MTKEELYQKAIDTWGIYKQTLMFHEEIAELHSALMKKDNLAEEIADCRIMTEQMAQYYDCDLRIIVEQCVNITTSVFLAYFAVSESMSHYERGRKGSLPLIKSLSLLHNRLSELSREKGLELFEEIEREQKLHRLASMLGVEYDGH